MTVFLIIADLRYFLYNLLMADEQHIFEKWKKQNEYINRAKSDHPELFSKPAQIESAETLSSIGIKLPGGKKPLGYLKFTPFDFIVEEIGLDQSLSTVDFANPLPPPDEPENTTIFCDLVKIGIPTTEAVKEVARALNLETENIGRAGLKDAVAVTSQKISIRESTPAQVAAMPQTNFFVKKLSLGKGLLDAGNLSGNRFTIFVRTETPVEEEYLKQNLQDIADGGFWNFYWLQRFGSRLLSHFWGAHILRGDYQGAVKSFLCDYSSRDVSFYRHVREQAEKRFGDWEAMKEIFLPLSYSMRHELAVLDHLARFRHDFVGALQKIPDQVQLWVYAYSSYLSNRLFSLAAQKSAEPPETLPLWLSHSRDDRGIYEKYSAADGIKDDFEKHIRPFNIRLNSRGIKTKILPRINAWQILPEGAAICFDLPKGAYATTFFAHFFTLTGGMPVPSWLKKTDVDVKEILGTGSLAETKKIFKDYTVVKEDDLEQAETG